MPVAEDVTATPLVRAGSIEELCGHRDRAIELFVEAERLLAEASQSAALAAPSVPCAGHIPEDARLALFCPTSRSSFGELMRRSIDADAWEHLIKAAQLERIMDRTARSKFREQLKSDPAPFTAETARSTMETLLADSELIFKRGVAQAFSGLDRRFRTHDGFKIGSKIILERAFDDLGYWNHHRGADETLRDVERALYVLDGKPHPDRNAGIAGTIDEARRHLSWGPKAFYCEDDYFRFRVHKNGNAHVWFKRNDLLRKVNLLLADYYGAALGAGADVADSRPPFRAPKSPARKHGDFPSPPAVVSRVLSEAQIAPGLSVLEPSAGKGNLALAAADAGAIVDCFEIQAVHADALATDPRIRSCQCRDFLDVDPAAYPHRYDRIVMNPPFDRGWDIVHVLHALQFLAPGGLLVSVMSAGTEFREDRASRHFRSLLEDHNGTMWDLPAASFSEVGTNVHALLCVIRAPR
ncbi:DUF4942 domain-containing protein [Amorphus sp. 3PC139-8]|uniref:DUF4942 domain-containing protein n=1 Tax=Amorphus sp. 3PC139-8 TaxID=2735676 RepID=UPI00345C96FA